MVKDTRHHRPSRALFLQHAYQGLAPLATDHRP